MAEQFEGFVYMNVDEPMVAWNIIRGTYYTHSCLPLSERNGALSFRMANLLRHGNAEAAKAEFKLEQFRQLHFPSLPSRLEAIFVFDAVESVAELWDGEGWGGHFVSENLTDVGISADNSIRLDANWITLMRDANHVLVEGWETLAWKYWSGERTPSEPIWERLVNGHVTVWGTDLKLRAYYELQLEWAASMRLLEHAANFSRIGSLDGMILPRAIKAGDNIKVDYYLRMVDAACPDWCARLRFFLETGGEQVCRLDAPHDDLQEPDFSMYSFQRTISELGALTTTER